MFEIPIPQTYFEFLWIGIGLQLGLAYGDRLDEEIKNSKWFASIPNPLNGFLIRTLKFMHHWILGLILVVYCNQIPSFSIFEALSYYWLGFGLFMGDALDYPLKQYIKKLNNVDATPTDNP